VLVQSLGLVSSIVSNHSSLSKAKRARTECELISFICDRSSYVKCMNYTLLGREDLEAVVCQCRVQSWLAQT
jgi:hypothetical protein